MASAVTGRPSAFAAASSATDPRVERWAMWTRAPVCRASTTSRATMASSAAAGIGRRPSRVATAPSWATPSPARFTSSQCEITAMSKWRLYSRARRITPACMTGRPSSETARQPAATRSPNSAMRLPCWPAVMQPTG